MPPFSIVAFTRVLSPLGSCIGCGLIGASSFSPLGAKKVRPPSSE